MVKFYNIELDEKRMPFHIAIILDGNRRWAKERKLQPMEGHKAGVKNLENILRFSKKIGIKILTVYAFSNENWKRSPQEVNFLMDLVDKYFRDNLEEYKDSGIRVVHSGRKSKLSDLTRREIFTAIKETRHNSDFIFNICFNYGGRQEIIDGIKRLAKDILSSNITIRNINEKRFSQYLYNPDLPDPDLIIRTSGEKRVSNFLLWQSAYSEWYFTDTYWPDFNERSLIMAIKDYQTRERRFGK